MRFEGKTALVTGAASGFGHAAALLFAREGARVAALDLTVADSLGPGSISLICDVSDESAVEAAVSQAAETLGPLDAVFNNAGIAARQPVDQQDSAGLDDILRVNCRGAFLCAKHVIPHMRKPGGAIVNTSSVVGLVGVRNRAAYSMSKGATIALTKSMALDYAAQGIRVNAVCPGFAETGLTRGLFANQDRLERIRDMHPLGRFPTAEDVARAVLFLCSSDAACITGQALAVDGGFSIGRPEDI
jgi:NAD(P)-dependent dehydrogenase (short-subunit alcohol dehydrogenase family)